jgi:hypothetical protein
MMSKYPRAIFFKDGKAVGTTNTMHGKGFDYYDSMHVMQLPSDHYDFLGPINVVGKTKEEIEAEIKSYE